VGLYHGQINTQIAHQRILHTVMLELTYQCNLDCFYCYNDKAARGVPLSFEQYVTLLQDLARLQTLFLTFTGGEPMVHPRFFDLGEVARDLGFAVIVRTNGHTLTRKVAQRLLERVDPYQVTMSLHGATAATHDRQTRVPGSFDQLMANIRDMQALGINQRLVCTPTAWNEHELPQIHALVQQLGVGFAWQGPVGPRDNGDIEPMSIQPSPQAWRSIGTLARTPREVDAACIPTAAAANLIATSAEPTPAAARERVCGIGTKGVDIDPFGNVHPCMHIKRSAGNLHQQGIEEIWYGRTGAAIMAQAEQLSLDAAQRFAGKPLEQHGAPLFCPAVEINSAKGCASGGCGSSGCAS